MSMEVNKIKGDEMIAEEAIRAMKEGDRFLTENAEYEVISISRKRESLLNPVITANIIKFFDSDFNSSSQKMRLIQGEKITKIMKLKETDFSPFQKGNIFEALNGKKYEVLSFSLNDKIISGREVGAKGWEYIKFSDISFSKN